MSKQNPSVYTKRKALAQQGANLRLVRQTFIVGEMTEVPHFLLKQRLGKYKKSTVLFAAERYVQKDCQSRAKQHN